MFKPINFSIQFDTCNQEGQLLILRGHILSFQKIFILSLETDCVLVNSADPGLMSHHVVFHQSLHGLYPIMGFAVYKGHEGQLWGLQSTNDDSEL